MPAEHLRRLQCTHPNSTRSTARAEKLASFMISYLRHADDEAPLPDPPQLLTRTVNQAASGFSCFVSVSKSKNGEAHSGIRARTSVVRIFKWRACTCPWGACGETTAHLVALFRGGPRSRACSGLPNTSEWSCTCVLIPKVKNTDQDVESKTNRKKSDENGKVLEKELSSDFHRFSFTEEEKQLSTLKYWAGEKSEVGILSTFPGFVLLSQSPALPKLALSCRMHRPWGWASALWSSGSKPMRELQSNKQDSSAPTWAPRRQPSNGKIKDRHLLCSPSQWARTCPVFLSALLILQATSTTGPDL